MSSHLKKCEICGMFYEESNDLDYLVAHGPAKCPHCLDIIELRELISSYDRKQMDKSWNNEIHEKHMIPVREDTTFTIGTTYELAKHKNFFEIENRTKRIFYLIDKIKQARKLLIERVGAQFEILDTFYEKKMNFWFEGGNFFNFVSDASVQYIVIKLKELISGTSACSIQKLINIIQNEHIYDQQHIFEVYEFEDGESFKFEYDHFPIIEYLEKKNQIFEKYKKTINAIKDLRDKEYAHIEGASEESHKSINYCGLKRIYNSLRIIYDGLLYSLAPDVFTNISIRYNMTFDNLENIVKLGKEKEQEINSEFEKKFDKLLAK